MINWTFSRFTKFPPLKTAQLLERFFSVEEIEEFQKFKIPKRQAEWLASRLLVKQLVQKVIAVKEDIPSNSISIQKESSGVPYIVIEGLGRVGWLSISHSQGGVLAAFSQDDNVRFGVDLEHIEPRLQDFFGDFFTPDEIVWLFNSDKQYKDIYANLIWSAKEAYLKALEKGLQMDTRRINIHPFIEKLTSNGWNELSFSVNGKPILEWQLLFSHHLNYVMNICLPVAQKQQFFDLEELPNLEG
ncbi:MAG: hypothetical protein C0410_03125 [Anaerolinea sp.]|nr:hypothetical protein [Anaerolinea sp.]